MGAIQGITTPGACFLPTNILDNILFQVNLYSRKIARPLAITSNCLAGTGRKDKRAKKVSCQLKSAVYLSSSLGRPLQKLLTAQSNWKQTMNLSSLYHVFI